MLTLDEQARFNSIYISPAKATQRARGKKQRKANQSTHEFAVDTLRYALDKKLALPKPLGTIVINRNELPCWRVTSWLHLCTLGLVLVDRFDRFIELRPQLTTKQARKVKKAIEKLLLS